MAFQQTDTELLSILQSSSNVLTVLSLPQSATIVTNIHVHISSTIPPSINANTLGTEFHRLQTTSETEFGNTPHRLNLIRLLNGATRRTIVNNQTEMRHVLNEPNVVEVINMRMDAFRILRTFEQIIRNGSTNVEERMIGFSYFYLALVDGIYRNSLRISYIWEQLSHSHQVDTTTIWQIDIHNIRQYFITNNLALDYFNGWNRNVRNAIGHSTFRFDNTTNNMIYEDRRAQVTVTLSEPELIVMIQDLFSVYELILLHNQIFRVNDVCDTFIQRYP